MALDATPGGATANSYVTREEAVAYMATHLYASAFLGLTDDQKDTALQMATRLIDRFICFLGTSTTTTQALRFPMQGLVDLQGREIPDDEIPSVTKDATSELARLLASTDYTAPSDAAVQGLTRLKAGPVELGFKDAIEAKAVPDLVRSLFPKSWLCPTPEEEAATKARKAEFRLL